MLYVIEVAEAEDCSIFYHETEQTPDGPWYRQMLCYTDADEPRGRYSVTSALRHVTGHYTAVHPKEWP